MVNPNKIQPSTISKSLKVIHEKLEIVALYADIRRFSLWARENSLEQAAEVIQIKYERVIQLAQDYKHTYHKFLGDGFLLIWELDNSRTMTEALHQSLGAAFELHEKYWYLSEQLTYTPPEGMGISISCGEVIKVRPRSFSQELNEPDFVGYPLNCGARLQHLAAPYGVVLDSKGAEIVTEVSAKNKTTNTNFEMVDPTTKAKEKASTFKGLKEKDRQNFKYVTSPYLQKELWETDGRLYGRL